MIQKIALKNLPDANIAKYYLLTLTLSLGKKQFNCPKTGKEKCHVANVFLHYLQSCLKGYDGKFRFENVVGLKEMINRLPESASERFTKQNLQMKKIFFSFYKGCEFIV